MSNGSQQSVGRFQAPDLLYRYIINNNNELKEVGCTRDMKISCIIWDYDGTIVDTRLKNLNVTKAIISSIINDFDIDRSVLNSVENYDKANNRSSNWRDLYKKEFGLNEEQIDEAGKMWTKIQLLDKTDVELFEGISNTVPKLSEYPQGIVSQNSSRIIKNNLEKYGLVKYFDHVVGYEEVDLAKQKPDPEGLLTCISRLANQINTHSAVYIGDHATDIICAHYANERAGGNAVISILLNNKRNNPVTDWEYKPDYTADRPEDIPAIVEQIRHRKH